MSLKPTILIIDDEVQIRRLLEMTLDSNGFRVVAAENAAEGLRCAATEHPDVIMLDLGLPDQDGSDVLRSLRAWSKIPVIILSVRSGEQDIISCLDAGANDYLTKPFRTGELLARVRAALRLHTTADGDPHFTVGELDVDLSARTVKNNGQLVHVTAIEYSLLALFVRNAGRVLTHRYILQEVWGPNQAEETQYLRVYVGQLRKKLEKDPSSPRLFLTESGIGYRMATE